MNSRAQYPIDLRNACAEALAYLQVHGRSFVRGHLAGSGEARVRCQSLQKELREWLLLVDRIAGQNS